MYEHIKFRNMSFSRYFSNSSTNIPTFIYIKKLDLVFSKHVKDVTFLKSYVTCCMLNRTRFVAY